MKGIRNIGCVVMAAGNASRFGTNKLAVQLDGRSLIQRTLEALPVPLFRSVWVVTQYQEAANLAENFGFSVLRNQHPEWGISHSLQLGLGQLLDCDGVLFTVSDQPMLRQESIVRLVELWVQQPDKIAAMSHGGVRGNPCLFPARFFPELLEIRGDRGGGVVIRRHEDEVVLLEISRAELHDVDTPAALNALLTMQQEKDCDG